MTEKNYRLGEPEAYILPAAAAEKLLSSGDGDAALLYIHMLTKRGCFEPEAAEKALRLSPDRLKLAAERLCTLGIATCGEEQSKPKSAAAEEKTEKSEKTDRTDKTDNSEKTEKNTDGRRGAEPQHIPSVSRYTSEEIADMVKNDEALSSLADETERRLGRVMSSSEYTRLVGLYEELGLSAEAIMLLISHVVTLNVRRGKRTTMRDVEREGYKWANLEIYDAHSAEEYLREQEERGSATERVRAALQITGHALSPTEREYINGWLDLGYQPDALAEAYDRTVVNTGKLTWKYMDSIVKRWHEKGLVTLEAVREGDKPQKSRQQAETKENDLPYDEQDDIEWMRRYVSEGRRKEGSD